MWKQMLPGLRMTLLLTVLTGLIYPGVVTGLCQVLFPLTGQRQPDHPQRPGDRLGPDRAELHQARVLPAAAVGGRRDGYDASASSGSNLGPTSQKLMDRVKASVGQSCEARIQTASGALPADLVTASGSGLDPHLSPASACRSGRPCRQGPRHFARTSSSQLVEQLTEGRDLGFLGEPRVNVLALNLALDEKFPSRR